MSVRFIIRIFVWVLACAVAAPSIAAPERAQAQGVASARIVAPLSARTLSPLEFGAVASRNRESGTVVMQPTGAKRHFTGGAKAGACDDAAMCSASPATFIITGEPEKTYRIALPDTAIAHHAEGSSARLRVTNLTLASANSGANTRDARLDRSGRDIVSVGGTLLVASDTPPGRYTARIEIVVTYD